MMSNPMTARRLGSAYGGGPPLLRTRYWSATMWIIVITSAISVTDMFLLGRLTHFGGLKLADIKQFYLWQIFTYQLLHAGPIHLIFNMLWLFLLGPIVEPMVGKTRYFLIYVVGGTFGGAAFLLMEVFGIGGVARDAVLVGASGSILAIMAAATCIAPRYPIRFLFPPITVHLWVLFMIAI